MDERFRIPLEQLEERDRVREAVVVHRHGDGGTAPLTSPVGEQQGCADADGD